MAVISSFALSGRRGRYANATAFAPFLLYQSKKNIWLGGVGNAARGLISRDILDKIFS